MKNETQSMHHFRVEDAVNHGVDKAVILSNLRFWLSLNKDKKSKPHCHDGYYWVYNSAKELATLFPYFTQSKVQRLLKQLEKDKVILVGNYNKVKYDRTRWYSLPEYSIDNICDTDNTELNNGSDEIVEPIPDTKHLSKPNINTDTPNIPFSVFWNKYDYAKGQVKAVEAKWLSLSDEERTLTMQSLDKYILSTPDKTFRKYPMTYLNTEAWNDEVVIPTDTQNKADSLGSHNNVYSASFKPFDTDSSNHTKTELESKLEGDSFELDKGVGIESVLAASSAVHWSELKAKGLLKPKTNPSALNMDTKVSDSIDDFLNRNGSKRFNNLKTA